MTSTKRLPIKEYRVRDKSVLVDRQESFVLAMLADPGMDAKKCAEAVGYQRPSVAACKLMKDPNVVARLKQEKRKRQDRTRKTADQVLEYLENAVFFNPFKYFSPGGKGGGWLIKEIDLKALPDFVGQLVTDCEFQEIETETGVLRLCKVRFVDKSRMVEFLSKHHGIFEKDNSQLKPAISFDLSQLYKRLIFDDPVEALIANPTMTATALDRDARIEEENSVSSKIIYQVDEFTEDE